MDARRSSMGGVELLLILAVGAVVVAVGRKRRWAPVTDLRIPDSKLLKLLLWFFAAGLVVKITLLLVHRDTTLTDKANNFFTSFILTYCYGAFGSEIKLVWLGATAAGVAYALAICKRGPAAALTAKRALTALFILSLFTLWLEPFLSIAGVATNILLALAKVPMKFVDIGVSIVWFVLLRRAIRAIELKVAPDDEVVDAEVVT